MNVFNKNLRSQLSFISEMALGLSAVIQEYKAQGKLTRVLYTVVGFDDGLGIIIFGFAFAIARGIIIQSVGAGQVPVG